MAYREIIPSEPLRPYINCFWVIEDAKEHELYDVSFPDGCLEIIFNMGALVERATNHVNFKPNPSIGSVPFYP